MGMMETGLTNPATAATAHPQEFLTFRLGSEEYGIDILKVQEIRGYDQVTRIANAPAFIKGVVNLRGVIVPIVDLRIKFNLGEARREGHLPCHSNTIAPPRTFDAPRRMSIGHCGRHSRANRAEVRP